MQVPQRKSEQRRLLAQNEDNYLTAEAIRQMREEAAHLEKDVRPRILEDLTKAREMGDLSENAAYSDAKRRLMGTDARIFTLKERLKTAVVIERGSGPDGRVRVGSKVTVEINGKEKVYDITGSLETDPAHGRISHASPLGLALLNRRVGEQAVVRTDEREITYRVTKVE